MSLYRTLLFKEINIVLKNGHNHSALLMYLYVCHDVISKFFDEIVMRWLSANECSSVSTCLAITFLDICLKWTLHNGRINYTNYVQFTLGCQLKDTEFSYIMSDAFKNVTIHSLKIQEQSHVNAFLIWPQTIRRWSLFPVQRSRDLYHSSIGLPATLRMYCSILLTADDLEMSVLLSNDFDLTEVLQK